ncbi:hypothetical protein E2C01_030738 [Portunus trituberculatus]|uniref:Uncharacterized protein n=1 Tax=Portunus trituberculatus TaxID=210409 RepID=A0A5B7EY66_PORTR|nr:hypothetical protein [Portunus trituberculatus]
MKRVQGEIPSRLLPTNPGVKPGKLSDVTGVLKMADGDTKWVGEGAWTGLADGAGGIRGFLRDALHVPFQQARGIMDDFLVAGVGVASSQGVCFGEDLKHTDIGTS